MTQPIKKSPIGRAPGGGRGARRERRAVRRASDIAPGELMPEEQASLALTLPVRNRIVTMFRPHQEVAPGPLFTADTAKRVTLGNLEDDLGLIADADWIVEVVEQLEPKRALMERIEQVRKPGSIVSEHHGT